MAVISVSEKTGGRGGINEKGETTYTRTYVVLTNSPLTGSYQVLSATKIPRRGDIYATAEEFDETAFAKEVTADQDGENPRLWVVTANYGTLTPEEKSQQEEPNPLMRPSVITWGFTQAQRAVWKDKDGKPIQNTAGDWYDPPIEINESRPVLTVSRNEPVFNPGIAIQYQDALNSDSFFGASPGQCKVAGITGQNATEGKYSFWQVGYTFEFRRDGWQPQILNMGRNYKTSDGKLAPIWQLGVKEDGTTYALKNTAITEPVPLNQAGTGAIYDPNPNNVIYNTFKVYAELPFASLGVP